MSTDRTLPTGIDLREQLPREAVLSRYQNNGLCLGRCYLTSHEISSKSFSIPPALQRRHIAHLAHSGEGKTTTVQIAALYNSQATNGVDFIIDPKGGLANGLMPVLYHSNVSLEKVIVLNASGELPRAPLFDLRPYLSHSDIDVSRQRLIEIVVDGALGVLEAASFSGGFHDAPQSVELLRSVITALFHSGIDYFSIEDLLSELNNIAEGTFSISVDHSVFQQLLAQITTDDAKMRRALANGAIRRLAPLVRSELTANAFGNPPMDPTEQWDFYSLLDTDKIIIYDLGGLNSFRRELLARVIVSRFFIAGRLRPAI